MIYQLILSESIGDVEEVRVLEWHGDIGHSFEAGELIVELETYKALVEIRAGKACVLRKLLSLAGEWQSVGQSLAVLSDARDEVLPESLEELQALAVNFEVS